MKTEFVQPTLPLVARQACAEPVQLPDRSLTPREITPLWGKDRSALLTCEARRAAAVAAVDAVPTPQTKPKFTAANNVGSNKY